MRALRRIAILAVADAEVILLTREMLQMLHLRPGLSGPLEMLLPVEFLGGWGASAAMFVGLVLVGSYGSHERWASPGTVLKGVALGAALATWQSIDVAGFWSTAVRWAVVVVVMGSAIALVRHVLAVFALRYLLAGRPNDRAILVGDPSSSVARYAMRALLERPGVHPVGWLSEQAASGDYLGHPSAVWEVLCDTGTDTVVLCGELAPALFDTVVEAAAVAGCRVLSVRSHGTLTAAQPRALRAWNGHPLRTMELTFPASRAGQDVVKRLFDMVLSAFLLVVLSPLLLLIAALIKLDSMGPVFFVQDRVGQAGTVFRMIKFRTMGEGADDYKAKLAHLNSSGDPRLFKIRNDPRVTRIGAFLRRWSMDELPQLINVLRGEMSLVGPRPFFESDLAAYDDHHFVRLSVKPGVTGLWQVKGRSSIVDFEEVVRLDRQYVENWSFWTDLHILALTLPAVARRTGAY